MVLMRYDLNCGLDESAYWFFVMLLLSVYSVMFIDEIVHGMTI